MPIPKVSPRSVEFSLNGPVPEELETLLCEAKLPHDSTLQALRELATAVKGLELSIEEFRVVLPQIDGALQKVEARVIGGESNFNQVRIDITPMYPLEALRLPPGITQKLKAAGYTSSYQLNQLSQEDIESVPGIGPVMRQKIMRRLQNLKSKERDSLKDTA